MHSSSPSLCERIAPTPYGDTSHATTSGSYCISMHGEVNIILASLKAISCSAPRDQEALFCSKPYSDPEMLSNLAKTCHKHLACPKGLQLWHIPWRRCLHTHMDFSWVSWRPFADILWPRIIDQSHFKTVKQKRWNPLPPYLTATNIVSYRMSSEETIHYLPSKVQEMEGDTPLPPSPPHTSPSQPGHRKKKWGTRNPLL